METMETYAENVIFDGNTHGFRFLSFSLQLNM
jgi:hypothetical protein